MIRTTFDRFDRVTIAGVQYQPLNQDHDAAVFMRLDGSGAVEHFNWNQIARFKSASDWRVERNFFAIGGASQTPQIGSSRVALLKSDPRNRVFFHHNICTVVEQLHRSGSLLLTYRSIEQNHAEIERLVNERESGRNADGRALRGGDRLAMRKLPCSKTILRHFRKFRIAQGNPDAIVPRYSASCRASAQADAMAEELLDGSVYGFAHPDQPTKKKVVDDTIASFREENARRAAEGLRPLRTYSRRTIERRIDRLDPFMVACHRLGVDAARKAFATYGAGLPKLFPMQRIEIDEWTVDLITYFGRLGITKRLPEHARQALPKGRRTICVAIDTATRCVLGLVLCANPGSAEALRLLRMVVRDKSDIAKEIGATSPWGFHGGLGVVATDAGTAFQSDEFQTAVHALHGRLEYAPIRVPEMRGTIERFFGTIEQSLMPRLSGRTFSDPVTKGDYDAEERAVFDDDDLLRILLMWVIDVYHHTAHGGLHGQTPADRWRELEAERFVTEPPDRHTRRTALGVEMTRTISSRGILLFANHYSCEALRAHFRSRKDRRLTLRIDPGDIGAISVKIGEEWHPAPAVDGGLDGISLEAWRSAFTRTVQRHRDQAELSTAAREGALREIQALVDRKVSLLLPDYLNPSPKQIDHLDRNHFHGRSFAPPIDVVDLEEAATPFGTPITPAAPTPQKPPRQRPAREVTPASRANPTWRIEDD